MRSYYVHIRYYGGEKVIPVYARSRKNAEKIIKRQYGGLPADYTIDAIFEAA